MTHQCQKEDVAGKETQDPTLLFQIFAGKEKELAVVTGVGNKQDRMRRIGVSIKCTSCGQPGHNMKTCARWRETATKKVKLIYTLLFITIF